MDRICSAEMLERSGLVGLVLAQLISDGERTQARRVKRSGRGG